MTLPQTFYCCVVFLTLVIHVYSATFYNIGRCPDDRKPGDRWQVDTSCLECYCDLNGYGCNGCGLVAQVPGCQIIVNKTAPNPECCPRLECPTLG